MHSTNMTHRSAITVRLDSFEGPLDLLLYLIQNHELDICKISISKITDQYLAYVRLMQELNFDIASDFLVMAATLVLWKSKSLLPRDEKATEASEEDEILLTQEDLVRQLLLLQQFRNAGQDLAGRPRLGEDVFVRPNVKPPVEKKWKQMDMSALTLTLQDILIRARRRKQVLKKETVSLSDKISEFKDRLKLGEVTELRSLMSPLAERPEVVVTFLASLELARLKRLRIYQEDTYQAIYVELIQTLRDFNALLATGFDQPIESIQPLEAPVAHVTPQIQL